MDLRAIVIPALLLVMPVQAQLLGTSSSEPTRDDRSTLSLMWTSRTADGLLAPLPSPWSYRELGVFCKLEVHLERRLRVPVLFRLGDVQRVEAMEGKGPLRELPLH